MGEIFKRPLQSEKARKKNKMSLYSKKWEPMSEDTFYIMQREEPQEGSMFHVY